MAMLHKTLAECRKHLYEAEKERESKGKLVFRLEGSCQAFPRVDEVFLIRVKRAVYEVGSLAKNDSSLQKLTAVNYKYNWKDTLLE